MLAAFLRQSLTYSQGLQQHLCCRIDSKIWRAKPGQQKVAFHPLSADRVVEELGPGANSPAAANEEKREEMLVPHLALLKLNKYLFFNKPFYSKCKILMFDSSYVTGCLLLCKQKYHLFFFFFLIFYFKTCSKDLNNADPAPKGNGF